MQDELPYSIRIPLLVTFGLFLFATNLSVLTQCKIPVNSLLDPSTARSSTRTYACYLYAIVTFGVIAAVTLLYRTVPYIYLVIPAYAIALFTRLTHRLPYPAERSNFMSILSRISIGGISTDEEGSRFMDIIVADMLTSYARVFGDAAVMLLTVVNVDLKWVVATAVSVPYVIRLRQCVILYRREGNKMHLANALKYATAFPVIFLAVLVSEDTKPLIRLVWIASCVINSSYSLYWDVAQDWDVDLRPLMTRPIALPVENRSVTLRHYQFFSTYIYLLCIAIDFVLRFIWTIKILPSIVHILPLSLASSLNGLEIGNHGLEYIEILRRWMWIFLRVECEYARSLHNNFIPGFTLPGDEIELEPRRSRTPSQSHKLKVDQD